MRIGDVEGAVVLIGVRVDDDLVDFSILPEVGLRCEFIEGEGRGDTGAVNHVGLEHPEVYDSDKKRQK